ncbi:MAG: type IX secretion system membrane protein PorP/SprF [Cytophagales bacterium]
MKNIIMKYLIFLLSSLTLMAQQDADQHITQSMFNRMAINPASTGVNDVISAGMFYRNQWLARIPGSPVYQLAHFQMPTNDKKMAFGGILTNDAIGFENRMSVAANGAYHIRSHSSVYSFGLQAGVKYYNMDRSKVDAKEQNDAVLFGPERTPLLPDFAFGFNYTHKNFFGGFSITHLNQTRIKYSGNSTIDSRLRRHYYVNLGYNYALDPYFTLKPSVLVRALPKAPVQADFAVLLDYNGGLWGGFNVRSGDALGFIVGVQLNKLNIHVDQAMRIGYAFDHTVSRMPRYNAGGSHEIMLQYDFRKKVKVHSPKFMKLE